MPHMNLCCQESLDVGYPPVLKLRDSLRTARALNKSVKDVNEDRFKPFVLPSAQTVCPRFPEFLQFLLFSCTLASKHLFIYLGRQILNNGMVINCAKHDE